MYIEMKEFADNFLYYIEKDSQFVTHSDEPYVLRGTLDDCDEAYCMENNIKMINVQHAGGTIVLTKSAIGYAFLSKDRGHAIQNDICNKFVKLLKRRGLNAEYKDNDILIDGYKVGSVGTKDLPNGLVYTPIQFSIDNDVELISKICLKPMDKIPKGLSDFGVTREDVLKFLEEIVELFPIIWSKI